MNCSIVLVFVQICCFSLIIDSASIVTGPQNTDAIIGGNITLHCIVENLESNTVVWRRSGSTFEYSRNRTISGILPSSYGHRYSVIGDNSDDTYNLYITGVDAFSENGHAYQCAIFDNTGVVLDFSEDAVISVHGEPIPPICNMDSYMDITDGDNVTFECVFVSSISKVEMNITKMSNTLLIEIVDPDLLKLSSMLSVNFKVTAHDDGAVLKCLVDHQLFQRPFECSLTINVKHKPMVEITQMGTLSDVNASFSCGVVANPNATQSTWSFYIVDSTIVSFDQVNDILTVESCGTEEIIGDYEMFVFDDMCYVFKVRETKLPVYVLLNREGLVVPENITVDQCLIECSATNTVGVSSNTYIIKNSICLYSTNTTTKATTTATTTTTPATTIAATGAAIVAVTTTPNSTFQTKDTLTKNTMLADNGSEDKLPVWVAFVPGFVICAFCFCIIFVIVFRRLVSRSVDPLMSDESQATHEGSSSCDKTKKSSQDNSWVT